MAPEGRIPVWSSIATDLRSAIENGELAANDQLPTEMELRSKYGVARATVRQALTALINEGLIVARGTRGHFVRDRKPMFYRPQTEFRPQPVSPEMDRFMAEHSADGRKPSQTIDVAIVIPSADVAKRLQLAPGETAVVRKRVRFLDNEPFNINDSYFPSKLVRDSEIMSPADIARGANQVMTELGYDQVRALDEIYFRMPTPDETVRLRLGPGTPVACHICTGLTEDGTPARVVVNVLPGDRHVIVYERDRAHSAAS